VPPTVVTSSTSAARSYPLSCRDRNGPRTESSTLPLLRRPPSNASDRQPGPIPPSPLYRFGAHQVLNRSGWER
jgi:hypothetical protein